MARKETLWIFVWGVDREVGSVCGGYGPGVIR